MKKPQTKKVLLAKLGLDGHDRGVLVVAMALKESGMEVIYLGRHQASEQIVESALQEDVDVVGLSSLADAHRTLVPKVLRLLRERGIGDVPLVLGGFIQPEDIVSLKESGVAEVFGLGSRLETITDYFKKLPSRKQL